MMLFCLIRKIWVKKTPEELVRQALVKKLITDWGYPQSLIVVEKSLADFCQSEAPINLSRVKLPKRRLDIICYANLDGSFFPLLLIECKRGSENFQKKEAFRQLLGYNYYIGAPFMAFANESGLEVVQKEPFLQPYSQEPTFSALINSRF